MSAFISGALSCTSPITRRKYDNRHSISDLTSETDKFYSVFHKFSGTLCRIRKPALKFLKYEFVIPYRHLHTCCHKPCFSQLFWNPRRKSQQDIFDFSIVIKILRACNAMAYWFYWWSIAIGAHSWHIHSVGEFPQLKTIHIESWFKQFRIGSCQVSDCNYVAQSKLPCCRRSYP